MEERHTLTLEGREVIHYHKLRNKFHKLLEEEVEIFIKQELKKRRSLIWNRAIGFGLTGGIIVASLLVGIC